MSDRVIIIGAGPAGLTAAAELIARSNLRPLVLEASDQLGGLSRTVRYKGNHLDIGGHRFFSKSDRVMDWWLDVLPLQKLPEGDEAIAYQSRWRTVQTRPEGPDPDHEDRVMLLRRRRSRIYYHKTFFDYPLRPSIAMGQSLGLLRAGRLISSYLKSVAFPRAERNLEDFFINRFGHELYRTFFKSYTEKVWGRPCTEISAEWGRQRIKGLSVRTSIGHAIRGVFGRNGDPKSGETSLIEQFLYPKHGPGQMWEVVAERVRDGGGEIVMGQAVDRMVVDGQRVTAVEAVDARTGERHQYPARHVISSMPVRQLTRGLSTPPPDHIRAIGEGLVYRDFLTVGLLMRRLEVNEAGGDLRDNWIYVHDPDVHVGRVQLFHNWSPYAVAEPGTKWLGLEYFCDKGDEIWERTDEAMIALATSELEHIGIINAKDVLDGCVVRMPKAYPAYFGTYDRFEELRVYLNGFENLFLVGRNGMHKYNNQDHAMLTAMAAVDNIVSGRTDKSNIWAVNTEQDYHEEWPEGETDADDESRKDVP